MTMLRKQSKDELEMAGMPHPIAQCGNSQPKITISLITSLKHIKRDHLKQVLSAIPFSLRKNFLPFSNSPHFLCLSHQYFALISPKLRVARITTSLLQPCDLNEIRLKQKEDLLEQEYLTGSMPFLTPTTVSRHVVVPRLSLLPQFFQQFGVKLSQEGSNATS